MSIREDIILNIIDVLKDMTDPKPILVSREPFDVEKLAVTQYPAILIQSGAETRADSSMRSRGGVISYSLRAFVRGVELDRQKNDIIEAIEEALEGDRMRATAKTNLVTEVVQITPIERLAPLGEVSMTINVRYQYQRGQT